MAEYVCTCGHRFRRKKPQPTATCMACRRTVKRTDPRFEDAVSLMEQQYGVRALSQ